MASTSLGTYLVSGAKISLNLLQDVSGSLPPPATAVVNLVQRIATTVETVKSNIESCGMLQEKILKILLVVLATIQKSLPSGDNRELAPNLFQLIQRFHRKLETMSTKLDNIAKVVCSQKKHNRVKAILLASKYQSDIKQCEADLDWAMREFDVATFLDAAIRLYEIKEELKVVKTNSFLESLPRAKYARHDSQLSDESAGCFPGTRETVLRDIKKWVHNCDPSSPRFFWLKGVAGIGKTTVARSIAEMVEELGLLGASFFFSRRGETDLRDPSRVFPTIAYQLARFDATMSQRITDALTTDPEVPFRSLQKQLEGLIVKPLQGLHHAQERVLIVFDAFDECESKGAETILRLLLSALPRLPFFLKIFVTGRDEEHLRRVLVPAGDLRVTALHDIEKDVAEGDIKLYLTNQLHRLGRDSEPPLPDSWVADRDIEVLASASGTLFIYAATSVRFLASSADPAAQLQVLLNVVSSSPAPQKPGQFYDLNKLYLELLLNVITPQNEDEVVPLLQDVLGSLVLLRDPLPVDALERLIGRLPNQALRILNQLRSVILPPALHDDCPRVYHPSFPDWIQDSARCTDGRLWINTTLHESRMAHRCLQIINEKLHPNMLDEPQTRLLNEQVDDLENKVKRALAPELCYVCRFWLSHLNYSSQALDETLLAELEAFVSSKLLAWLECLSWLQFTGEGIRALEALCTWIERTNCPSSTIALLCDVYRLLLDFKESIETAALHVPHSVLPFVPKNTTLAKVYSTSLPPNLMAIHGISDNWSDEIATLRGHSGDVSSVACSPDGSCIASGSYDKTVRLWDTTTGEVVALLEGHSDMVQSVAFSPDGTRIVSGSHDKAVKVWDVATGAVVFSMEGHSGRVNSVAFSPDSARIGSGSHDGTIKLWDVETGEIIASLKGHASRVNSIAFSLDGTRIVSGSHDRTVRVWDATTGEIVRSLKGHSSMVESVAYSPDGSRIVSGCDESAVMLWDTSTGAIIRSLQLDAWIDSVAFAPDGTRIAISNHNSTVRIWDASTGEIVRLLEGHTGRVHSVAFFPDSSHVVSGSEDGTVKIWDATSEIDRSMDGPPAGADCIAFSSDGGRVVFGFRSGIIKLYDATTGEICCSLKGHYFFAVRSIAFSPDGSHIVSFGYDWTVKMWATTTGEIVHSFKSSAWETSVAFSPDGCRVVATALDKVIGVWDARTGEVVEDPDLRPNTNPSLSAAPEQVGLTLSWSGPTGLSIINGQSSSNLLLLPAAFGACEKDATAIYRIAESNSYRVAVGYQTGRVLILQLYDV